MTFFSFSWRMLPPAGAPLDASAIFSALRSGENTGDALRAKLAKRFDRRHVHLADTGRAGLALALMAVSRLHPERDEALIPAYVSFSVPSAVVNAGLKVRLYDVDPHTLTPDYDSMRHALSERTLALVVCHQFGLPFDPAPAATLCQEHGALLIDDAAQAMGGKVKGSYAGCLGDVGLFSLSRGKPLTAVDGGILLTNNDELSRKIEEVAAEQSGETGDMMPIIKAFALFFLRRPVFYRLPASLPWLNIGASVFDPSFPRTSMSRFRMGLALAALQRLDTANAARAAIAARYNQELANMAFVRPVAPQADSVPIYLRFPILPQANGEKRLQALVRAKDGQSGGMARKLGISPGFPLPLDAIPALRTHLAAPEETFPGARFLADHLLTLPTHDQVREQDITSIARLFVREVQA